MRLIVRICGRVGGHDGGVLVMVALWMPLLIVMLTFVIDVGNWFVHKRHLQMQADAAALAAAQEFRIPCADAPIRQKAAEYSGDQYNAQIGGTPPGRVFRLVNSKTFYAQTTPSDDTVEGPPCSAGMIDVKLTETDLPWFFPPFNGVIGRSVPYINAHARVSINQIESSRGSIPVGVPDVNPKAARAYFINEATGTVLGSTPLTRVGTSGTLVVWDNADAPLPVKVDAGDVDVGVVIALGGGSSTTCGQPLVDCFDAGAPTSASGMPSTGVLYIRGWSSAGSGAQPNKPIVRDVTLVPGSCSDPYFSSATTQCTIGVRARVDFGTVNGADQTTAVGAKLVATVGGTKYALSYNATSKTWTTATTVPVAPGAGPVSVRLDWEETKGTVKLPDNKGVLQDIACSTANANKCTGSFGVVQRAFGASEPRSGPIDVAQLWENGVQWANALERCSSAQLTCTHNLVVRIGVRGNLANATSVNDRPIALRVMGGSQNQSLDCDPNVSTLKEELAKGCAPQYRINKGTACPGGATALWSTSQPWTCVAVQTGGATNQVPAGMNLRILGAEKPATCTAPNNWSSFPNIPPGDPRVLHVFLTPFGSFSGSGGGTVPITDFATFYITGWTGSGQGFANPCQGNGDDPVPNNDPGFIVGHFIKYIQTIDTGTGGQPCDLNAFGACVAAMTR